MTTPDTERRLADTERRLRQPGDDITAVYEVVEGVDRKVTDLTATVNEQFTTVDAKLDAILERLNER